MKRILRIALTVLFVITAVATVALCIYICTPAPGTDTADIGWKLGTALAPPLCAAALTWETAVCGCAMFFLWERKKWNIPLTIFLALLLLILLVFPVWLFG